jgi:hypothetical protein
MPRDVMVPLMPAGVTDTVGSSNARQREPDVLRRTALRAGRRRHSIHGLGSRTSLSPTGSATAPRQLSVPYSRACQGGLPAARRRRDRQHRAAARAGVERGDWPDVLCRIIAFFSPQSTQSGVAGRSWSGGDSASDDIALTRFSSQVRVGFNRNRKLNRSRKVIHE